jgi:D-alanine-D-alanine ligase
VVKRITLVLLYGGKSGEHEISLISAASILQNLDADKYHIIPIGMDKNGHCYTNDYQQLITYKDSLPVMTNRSKPLVNLLINNQMAIDVDVVFPMVHGPLYEDGCIQGVLELAGVAYVGCGVLSSAIGMDKDLTRRLVCDDVIRCARYEVLSSFSSHDERQEFCRKIAAELGWPVFVKPCSLGSSVGIHKAKNLIELKNAIDDALRYDETILVEEYLSGREIELAVLENAYPLVSPHVSGAGEIKVYHQDGFYSYTAKYLDSSQTDLIIPALLPDNLLNQLQQYAATIFTRLKCRGMARVDFFVNSDEGTIFFNEINTLPGFTPISMYPKLWDTSGLSYTNLLDKLIDLALMHQKRRQQLVTSYQ